jgi:hypothetical protein
MNYAPAVTDQSANIIMQGNRMSQESGQNALKIWQYLQGRKDAKDAALGQLDVLGAGGGGGTSAASSGGFDPSSGGGDPAGEDSSALDAAEANGKKADAIRNVLTAYNPHPQAKTALKAMSLGQLEGMLKGYAMKSAMEEHSARMQDYQAQAQLRTQQAADDQGIGTFLKNYASAPDVDEYQGEGTTMPRSASPSERFNYAMKIAPVSGRAVPRLIDALTKYGQATEDNSPVVMPGPYPGVSIVGSRSGRGGVHVVTDPNAEGEGSALKPTPWEDPVTGKRFLLYGKSAQASGENPEKAQPQQKGFQPADVTRLHALKLDLIKELSNPFSSATPDAKSMYQEELGRINDLLERTSPGKGGAAPSKADEPSNKGTYRSQAEVVSAFKSGKLSRGQAATILNQQFGVALK